MTHYEIKDELTRLFRNERENTKHIINLINEAEQQRTYAVFGYSKLFKWLVAEFKLSHGAAARRLAAARLIRSVPDAREKLEQGALNLSTLCQTQIAINAQEKATGEKLSNSQKADTLKLIENKSSEETSKVLAETLPESLPDVKPAKARRMKNQLTRCPLDLSDQDLADLKRAKQILSHQFPHGADADIFRYAIQFLLKKKDPLRKTAKAKKSAAASGCVTTESKAQTRSDVFRAAEGQCEFVGLDGHRCGEMSESQTDHIVPKGKGGSDERTNLRLLCRQHNLLVAEHVYGREHMNQFR